LALKKVTWRQHPAYLAEYLGGKIFMTAALSLPLPAAVKFGEWCGRRMIFWSRRSFRTAVDNILRAFPDLSAPEAEALAARVYEHFGRATVEVAFGDRLLKPSTFDEHIVFRNEEYLRAALAAGKGAIFVTGHLGPWEMFGLLARHRGVSWTSVYRPVRNPYIDRSMRRYRTAHGQRLVPKHGAAPALLRVLRGGGYIALLVDQHAKDEGLWTPFFGRPASTTPAPALLALRTGAPIVTGYACRLPGLYRFEVLCDEPLFVRPTGDRSADVRNATIEVNRRLEGYIRRFPDQWLWMHRRWRTPPEAAHNLDPVQHGNAESAERSRTKD
jgi:KDO2-lipid IV(A) lauroyltransferase